MRAGLIRHDIGPRTPRLHPRHQFREHIRRVAQQPDRLRLARRRPPGNHGQSLVQRPRLRIDIPRAQPEIDPRLVALHCEATGPRHHGSQGLRAPHAAQPTGQNPAPPQRPAVVLPPRLGKRLIRPLHDALGADVDPRPRRHLPVHHQTLAVQFIEMVPVRPVRHQIRVRNQHPRRIRMRPHHRHRPPRLHHQRLIRPQVPQRRHDPVEIPPGPRRPPDPAVHHQFSRVFCHIRVQVVHQHPQRRFRLPRLAGHLDPRRRHHNPGILAIKHAFLRSKFG